MVDTVILTERKLAFFSRRSSSLVRPQNWSHSRILFILSVQFDKPATEIAGSRFASITYALATWEPQISACVTAPHGWLVDTLLGDGAIDSICRFGLRSYCCSAAHGWRKDGCCSYYGRCAYLDASRVVMCLCDCSGMKRRNPIFETRRTLS